MTPLQHHLRVGTAFRRTPKEVFACIFELVTADQSLRDLRAICLVCRTWYKLAISLPKLWSYLPISRNASVTKLILWLQRSRDHALHIAAPGPEVDCLEDRMPFPSRFDIQDAMLPILARCGTLSFSCLQKDPEDSRGLEWVKKLDGQTFHRLEALSLHFSTHDIEFPSTCSFPRLRSLGVSRGTCKWPLAIIPRSSPTLTSFSLSNVSSSYSLSILDVLSALISAPSLEHFELYEVEWTQPNGDTGIPLIVNLTNLVSLSLTSVDDAFDIIQPLQIPRLRKLAIGDVNGDLGPVFADIARKTSSIQQLTTGLWEDHFVADSEMGLIELLEKQRELQSLVVGNASLSRALIQRLTPYLTTNGSADDGLCPQLTSLELPAHLECVQEIHTMVQSRFAAGMQLKALTLIGAVDSSWDIESLALYVRKLKVEKGNDID